MNYEYKSVLHSRDELFFREKGVIKLEDGVKLFFMEYDDSFIYLAHLRRGNHFVSYWSSTLTGDTREINSGKSLAVINKSAENKLKILSKDFASPEEVERFLAEAGDFVKNNYNQIFPYSTSLERTNREESLLNIYNEINAQYNVVIDKETYDLCIYDRNTHVYEDYDEKKLSRFLRRVTGEDLFQEEVKKLMGLFNNIKEEDPEYIAFNNCLMNIRTLETQKFDPNIYTRFKVPYKWNKEANSGFFEEKLREIFVDTKKFHKFLQIVGYLFVKGNPHNKLFLLLGDGANGKSLLMQLISEIFINSNAAVPLQDFKKEFGLQPLIGRRVNLLFDLPIETIEETGQLKAITGGDNITINRKFKDPLTTRLDCKIIGAGNRLPIIRDDSYALWRRIEIIKLTETFDQENRDTKLLQKLIDDQEGMEWLIYRSIEAYREIQDQGWSEDTYLQVRDQFLKSSDPALYAAEQLFRETNNPDDFISREDIRKTIYDFLYEYDLRIPAAYKEYYAAVRNIGGIPGQSTIGDSKVHGFRYIKNKIFEDDYVWK